MGTVSDFMESYELVAFDMPDGSPNVTVAGAVHGGASASGACLALPHPSPTFVLGQR